MNTSILFMTQNNIELRDKATLPTTKAIEFPEWRQPTGAHDAYSKGDKVSHNGKHWVSDVDGNVWEPGVYGWSEV